MQAPAEAVAQGVDDQGHSASAAPTLTTADVADVVDGGDVEKAAVTDKPAKPAHVMPTFPEGSLRGWMAVAGAWLVIFCTFGYANSGGVFQDYYQLVGYPQESSSNITWVTSIQLFLQFSLGAVVGPLYDKGYFRYLMAGGTVIYMFGLFMTSLCKEFWQVVLAQGIVVGFGIGMLFLPALSIISHYFHKKRALATGIVVTGSSSGGICLPIMLNKLIAKNGFDEAVRDTAYLLLGCLIVSQFLMHPRIPPNPNGPKKPTPAELFRGNKNKAYTLLCTALFFTTWGLFVPITFLQVYASEHNVSQTLVTYCLAILNAASVFGRLLPGLVADKVGSMNMLFVMTVGTGAMCFALFGGGTNGGMVVVAILFGFFSGAFVGLMSPAIMSLARNFTEIGMRVGFGMLIMSGAALSFGPIAGALLDKYGFVAPIIFSGVSVMIGAAIMAVAIFDARKAKGTWRV